MNPNRPPTVVNKYKDEYDVYIGRGSKWGNPFPITEEMPREAVIKAYRNYLFNQIVEGRLTDKDFAELEGKRLGCFCKPKACHGDVIVRAYLYMCSMNNLRRKELGNNDT